MFCYHCQEAKKNVACDTTGICGKKEDVSSLQDLLIYSLKGLAYYTSRAAGMDLVGINTHRFLAKALFSMVTNVNFDPADFVNLIDEAVRRRNSIRSKFEAACLLRHGSAFAEQPPEPAAWQYTRVDPEAFTEKGATVSVAIAPDMNADIHALQECLVYGVKGLGSLAVHALELGTEDEALYLFMHEALNFSMAGDHSLEDALAMTLRCGELGLAAMGRLNQANADKFGEPEPTGVYLDTWDRPGILVTGHDMQDIEDLLEQTAGEGIDIYTHGEAITAHAYPALKKYFNLVANFGGAWQDQKTEFAKFNGPVLVTTNSIQQPKKTYAEKLFSTGMVGWPDVAHIADRKPGQRKDFSALIESARHCPPPQPLTNGQFVTGYGLQALLALTDKIAAAIQSTAISRIIVMAGCDGRHKERRYYAQLAEKLPQDTLIMTAGDTKFRFYQMDFGQIGDIPRLLDAGQSNHFYSIIRFLQALQIKLGLSELNQVPVSFNMAWYEQKTILMMLALFALNVRNVRVGPTLPPFFTPAVLALLEDRYGFKGIDTVENDAAAMLAGA